MKIITFLLIIACTFTYPFKNNKGVGPGGVGPRVAFSFDKFETKNTKSETPLSRPDSHGQRGAHGPRFTMFPPRREEKKQPVEQEQKQQYEPKTYLTQNEQEQKQQYEPKTYLPQNEQEEQQRQYEPTTYLPQNEQE